MRHLLYAMIAGICLFSISDNVFARSAKHPGTTLFSGHKREQQSRLFLIVVLDTNDKDIGERCQTDLDEVSFAFDDLADWIGLDLQQKVIQGDDFCKDSVIEAVDNWLPAQHVREDDIVVFYYSGHGFRYEGDTSAFPRMWLKTATNQNVETNNLQVETDIYDHLIKNGAGMYLVLSDCCNTTDARENANVDNVTVPNPPRVKHKRDSDNEEEDDNAGRLFVPQHPLSILATAAAKSEYAAGKADVGGFFTQYFLESLEKCIYDNKIQPVWDSVFSHTKDKAGYWARSAPCPNAKHNPQGRCIQTLTYKIDQ